MLITDSSSKQRLLMADLTSSSCLTQSLKVQSSPLTSTLLRTPLTSLRTRSSTSPMLCATITTIGQTPLRSLLLACSQTRSPFIAARSVTFPQMLISTSFPSTFEEVEVG
jgi:23S rRNA A1618 N6-methylase RlmF